jgi:hypothetical protein
MAQQQVKCNVMECLHWAQGDNCDLAEIWVHKKPRAGGGGLTSAVQSDTIAEQDTFCASFDRK